MAGFGLHATRALLALALPASALPVPAAELQWVGREAAVERAATGTGRLRVEGLTGNLSFRLGRPGSVRYMARGMDDRERAEPVGLWLDGETLVLRPVDPEQPRPILLEVALPPGFGLELVSQASKIGVDALQGGVSIRGRELTVESRGLRAYAQFDIDGGSLTVRDAPSGLAVQGVDLEIMLQQVGTTFLVLRGGAARLSELAAGLEANLDGTTLNATSIAAGASIKGRGGAVELAAAASGARLDLRGTEVNLRETRGAVEVTDRDARVVFFNHQGSLRISGDEVSVRGGGGNGTLDIESSSAEVDLEDLDATTTIRGADLTVRVARARKDLRIETSSSTIELTDTGGLVVVNNTFGDVGVRGAARDVQVTSENGNVVLSGLRGRAEVRAAGAVVEVGWAALPAEQDSLIENSGGEVRLSFPAEGGCRVDGVAEHGRVQSDLPDLALAADAKHVSGLINRATKPVVSARSAGDLILERGIVSVEGGGQ